MSKARDYIYVIILLVAGVLTASYFWSFGAGYYLTSYEERFFNPLHELLKPSGIIGHGLGIIGSLMMALGVAFYMMRKRMKVFSRIGRLKIWLEFHIFLCSLGPILVLYHTAFKFGGLVAISFWSMVAVVISGVIGRFIYIQIPHSIQGNELSIEELNALNRQYTQELKSNYNFDELLLQKLENFGTIKVEAGANIFSTIKIVWQEHSDNKKLIAEIRKELAVKNLSHSSVKKILKVCKSKLVLMRKIILLQSFRRIFHYWHIIHLPFAIIMLVIMLIHVAITVAFGYKWIF